MAEKDILTIFTPTYNRANLLERVYRSLLAQTVRDFTWLIVDDGSTDDTEETVRAWQEESPFEIRYIYQENGGKMRAHNTGVRHTETGLFVCLDSDDVLVPKAAKKILKRWERIAGQEKYSGIVAHKGTDEIHPLYGEEFPPLEEAPLKELYRRGFHGETTLVFRTEILRQYPFPEIPGEKYVPEDYVYDQIDRHYVLSVMPEVLTVCELVESGYTDRVQELRRENPTAWYLYYVNRARETEPSLLKLKYASHCLRFRPLADRETVSREKLPLRLSALGLPGAAALALLKKL